uniref:Uncharacterized protein LOC104214959 n=1 Tax=Nicotiana sylvestris TaxID=4096 RepID=A0A1U7VDH6_NICSY|nr:PREDICTED: uncharacterized protein LOC104214959 [Nicotiana sylvestris]
MAVTTRSGRGGEANTSKQKKVVSEDVEVQNDDDLIVDKFILPADFVILDFEVDYELPIIVGRPFLPTGKALVDMEAGELTFRVGDEKVVFHVCKSMKQPNSTDVCSFVDLVTEVDATLEVLQQRKKEIGWTLADIRGLRPASCMHKIILEDDVKPPVEHQMRLNEAMQEVFKEEVINMPWFADVANFFVTGIIPSELSSNQRKKLKRDSLDYYWDEPYLFKICTDGVIQRCIPEEEKMSILNACHSSPYDGHHGGRELLQRF